MSFQLTKKQITKEIVQSGRDPSYFINNYAKISHPMHGLIPFKTYDYQQDLLENFNDHRFTVILKARQLGISTIVAAYVTWMMIFHRDKNILVMATKFQTASNLVKKVKAILKNLPEWIRIAEISVDNRTSFELTNGSQIKASSTSSDAGRSEALSLLVIDEAAHVEGLEDLWTALYPTLSTGGRCISLSTPNGVGNWFHQTYVDAEANENDFYPIKLPWDAHPDRDQDWFEKETKNMSRRQIAQELECNFNTSGETVVHPDDLMRMATEICEPKHRTGFDRNFWIWQEYDPNNAYLISADVARGDGQDHSAFQLFNVNTMEQVGEYRGKISLDLFANLLCQVGKEYGNCMVVVENNSVGYTVLDKLIEAVYPNLYYALKSSHEYIDPVQAEAVSNSVPGFSTTSKTRPLIIAKLEEFIRNQLININSSRTLEELKTFIWNNGKPQCMKGYNDDLVMSLAILCWVKDTALTTNERQLEYAKAFIGSMKVSKTKLNTTIPGMEGYKKDEDFAKIKKHHDQFGWLYKG